MFTENGNLTEYSTPFIPGENFTVLPQSGDEGRSFLRVTGEESGRVATIYPNYKNSWGKDENKQQAGDWVSSPSFQVIIK